MLDSNEGWAVGSEWIPVGSTTRIQNPRILYYGENVPLPPPQNKIPEVPLGTIVALSALLIVFAGFVRSKRTYHFNL
jgi:hypothetical protein